jgi:membrane associated rhomboid family serine protease
MSVHESSSTAVRVAPLQQHKWDLRYIIPAKPATWEYGYVLKGRMFGATRERLIDLVQSGAEVEFVWTPDTPELVSPECVPFLLDAFRRNLRRGARNTILGGAAFMTLAIVLAVGLEDWSLVYKNFFFVFGAVFLVEGIWQFARSDHYTQEDAAIDASSGRFAAWLKGKALSGYTFTLAAYIVLVGLTQMFVEDSIRVAGLVKPAVWDGQLWRLFTAILMHANFMHFWMNSLALIHFSKIIEQTVQRACVPLVFLLTGAVGSVFSVLFYPNSTSIGASGGLMGLLGFITIAAYFDRSTYPPKYFRQMIEAIISVGVLGVIGFAFIDNAAHLGGLVGGLLLGWFLFRSNEERRKEKLLKYGGVAALLVLGFIAAFAAYQMLR